MKNIINWILNKLNLHIDNNQKIILIPLVIVGLVFTYIHPTLTKEIVSSLPAEWLAFEALCSTLFGLIVGIMWQGKVRKTAIKYFLYLISAECVAGFILGMYLTFIEWNVWVFAIASLIYTNLITVFVSKCIMYFKSKLWIEKDREIYDNNHSIVCGITCVIGFGAALLILPSLKVAVFLWGLSCLVDDIGWGIVYYKNKNLLNKID